LIRAVHCAGPKTDLKSIYGAVIKAVNAFGKDFEIAPEKANVSLSWPLEGVGVSVIFPEGVGVSVISVI